MTRDEAREYILEHSAEYFEPDKVSGRGGKIKGYVCPICGSGTGKNGTGITTKDGRHFSCWRGCFQNADIFDILGRQEGLTDFKEQFNRACEIFGVDVDNDTYTSRPSTKKTQAPLFPLKEKNNMQEVKQEVKELLTEAARHLEETDYHRGISLATLKKFGVGYASAWRVNENAPSSPRLIVPHSDGAGYLARDTRINLTDEQKNFAKMHRGNKCLFNPQALEQNAAPVFVVEGEIDAMSIVDVGGQAIGLCSSSNAGKLIAAVKEKKPSGGIIIVADNDETGKNAAEKISENLSALNFFSYRYELPTQYKDANDFLMNDRAAFTDWVKHGISECEAACKKKSEVERKEFENETVAAQMGDFLSTLLKSREGRQIPTGFRGLDEILDGGLYPGLYIVGAISSLGKTTFCLQIADQIARTSRGVLVFSLEMSRNELIAKSLSRETLIKDLAEYNTTQHAKTTRGILRRDFFDETEIKILRTVISQYKENWGRNIFISEGIGNIGVEEIRSKIERYSQIYEEPPVVFIDYLQIIAPYSEKATDKQNTDKNVLELKRISRDYQIPIIGISSFNRENYSEPVSMASFKESGAIEYSSDVLIGLQYDGFDYRDGEKDTERKKRIREILKDANETAKRGEAVKVQCKILKHRNGRKGSVLFEFYPMFNFYRERGGGIGE